ncbi:serine/threonine-protein kinase 3-like [Xenopus laevis]|uniref:Serine/threonine-protein kinase 3-like n=1 Tax=Xenopus laevis TaxID=8355 RepID=A0A8J1M1I5_XENLA|nr:serine/threonine-protein kinase 3-like [Xenopus laevis]
MEYCRGGSLMKLIEGAVNNSLSEVCIRYIAREVLEGLHYMHHKCVVHRDIKSPNITLNRHGTFKIIDFGLAVQLDRIDKKIIGARGTTCWMAPEVIGCRYNWRQTYNFKCDIWSFGITLIEMADGQSPYERFGRTKAMEHIFTDEPPRLKREHMWSYDFVDFLGQCLIRSPKKRPTATQLLGHPFIMEQPEADQVKYALTEYAKTVE